MSSPRNVLARNWQRMTLDVTLGNPWRLGVHHRRFRIFTDGPREHRFTVALGPVRVSVWPKSREMARW